MTAVLELRQVSKVYGSGPTEVHALREVDLEVGDASWWRSWGPAAPARARC
jgi:putative ABC transport system ATP-binding protein